MDFGLSNSFMFSVETSTLGMDHTFSTSFPSIIVTNIETMVADILQENTIQIYEDLEKLKN